MMNAIPIRLGITTCYLIPMGGQYLLIDTGYARNRRRFFRQLKKNGAALEEIAYILLTHHHDDHAGLVNELTAKNPAIKVIMHEKAAERLSCGKNDMRRSKYINRRVSAVIGLFKKLSKGVDSGFPLYIQRDGDLIVSRDIAFGEMGINIPGDVILTPGHSDDSMAVVLDNGCCFCGDAAASMLMILGTKHCVIVVEDLKQYYASWEKMIGHQAKKIYPAHGQSFGADTLKKYMGQNTVKNLKALPR